MDYNRFAITPIPVIPDNNPDVWKKLPIKECGEPLVALGPFSDYPNIFQDSIYFGERESSPYQRGELTGALITPFLRKGVADRLNKASLPERHAFLIWDSYRPLSVQQALFDDYFGQLTQKGMSAEKAKVAAQKFVSIPSTDPTCPPPHFTGGSVDLTIIEFSEKDWCRMQELNKQLKSEDWRVVYTAEMERWKLVRQSKPLDMGGKFDGVSAVTATRYYEQQAEKGELTADEQIALTNRRLLVNTLRAVELINYPGEWWHFDSGNQFAAERTGQPAIYGAADFSEACRAHEEMRRGNLAGNEKLASDPFTMGKLGEDPIRALVRREAVKFGLAHLQPHHPRAERLTVSG